VRKEQDKYHLKDESVKSFLKLHEILIGENNNGSGSTNIDVVFEKGSVEHSVQAADHSDPLHPFTFTC
jgi:hypothetical protein